MGAAKARHRKFPEVISGEAERQARLRSVLEGGALRCPALALQARREVEGKLAWRRI
jgi:hypothetical protein